MRNVHVKKVRGGYVLEYGEDDDLIPALTTVYSQLQYELLRKKLHALLKPKDYEEEEQCNTNP